MLLLVFKSWEHASIVAVEAGAARLITEDSNTPLPNASAAPVAPPKPAIPSEVVTVTASDVACTTEPSGEKPNLRALPSGAGAIRVGVIGRGDWCHGQWSATRAGDQITILNTPSPAASPCGTCSITLTLSSLPAGSWTLNLAGASLTTTSR